MIEQLIYLEGIDPAILYGVNNNFLDKIKAFFPKLKIVARGNEIRVFGDEEEISRFDDLIHLLIEHLQRFNRLSETDLDRFFTGEFAGGSVAVDPEGVLVYGNHGKMISARTVNQRKLAGEYIKNDLVFAIGPAGTGKTYTAIALAVKAFKNKEVKKIILTRPAVEAGEHLGFLPGDVKEKLDRGR